MTPGGLPLSVRKRMSVLAVDRRHRTGDGRHEEPGVPDVEPHPLGEEQDIAEIHVFDHAQHRR